jgi:hypothetical protein
MLSTIITSALFATSNAFAIDLTMNLLNTRISNIQNQILNVGSFNSRLSLCANSLETIDTKGVDSTIKFETGWLFMSNNRVPVSIFNRIGVKMYHTGNPVPEMFILGEYNCDLTPSGVALDAQVFADDKDS